MHIAIATLESTAPYSQSRFHNLPKLDKESAEDYETRTWRHKLHADSEGRAFIPPTAFKNCLSEAAKYLALQIPGKGKATYTKHFEAGVLVIDAVPLDVTRDTVDGEWLHVPSDGRRGGPKRVMRCFPYVPTWGATVAFHILDDTITRDVFEKHLAEAGNFIGIGRFRPRNNGYYGRFKIAALDWQARVA